MEAFGECPPMLPAAGPEGRAVDDALGAVLGERARWLARYGAHALAELDDRALRRIYEDVERPLVPVLAAMEHDGIRVEPARLEAFAKELERNLDNLTREIHQLAGEVFTIASPKQLAQILFEKLKLPALRRTKTGYSTDADVLTELAVGPSVAGQGARAPHAVQAEGHLRRRAAGAREPRRPGGSTRRSTSSWRRPGGSSARTRTS